MFIAHTVFPAIEAYLDKALEEALAEEGNDDYHGYFRGYYIGVLNTARTILRALYGDGFEITVENRKHTILPSDMKGS